MSDGPKTDAARPLPFTCPVCGAVSYNPNDAAERYCGRCRRFTGGQANPLPLTDLEPSTGGPFTLHQVFFDGTRDDLGSYDDEADVVQRATDLVTGVGARVGTTKQVIIADRDGFRLFEWVRGKGIVFPPRELPPQLGMPAS